VQIENPLQQEFLKPEFIIDTIIRRRWLLIIPLLLALSIGSCLVVMLPKIYEAETLILVEPQRVPTNYVQSVVSSEVEERINTLSQQILSRTNLEKIIGQFNLYTGPEFENMFLEDKVNALRKDIKVEVTQNRRETNSFSIAYRGKDPQTVMDITNTLTTYFIDENLKVREAQAIGTSDFLEAELVSMRRRLEEQERLLEAYRTSNMGELPEQLETNLRILDRLQEQLTERQQGLRDARSRLATLRNQASAGLLPDPAAAGDAGRPREPNPLDPDALQAELARLQSRYTDKHPDILKIKQQIKDLEKNGTASVAETPAARREPVQITDVRREIENTAADIGRIQSEIMTYERRVESTPKREQELMALQRDYENLQESYSSLLNRKLEADISVNMERKQKGEQFRVLDQARLPKRPVEPNMRRLFLITIAAGIGIGGGIIFLLEYMNAGFRSPKEVELSLGLPMIALLPFIEDRKTRMLKKLNWVATGLAVAAAGVMLVVFAALALQGVEESLTLLSEVKNLIL